MVVSLRFIDGKLEKYFVKGELIALHEPLKGVISSNGFHYRQHDDQAVVSHQRTQGEGPNESDQTNNRMANLGRSAEKNPVRTNTTGSEELP